MLTALIVLILLGCIFAFTVKGRRGHRNLPELRKFYYAHRGLHSDGIPENSMAAFRTAKESGYGIELDVHLLRDGTLAVIHDSSLVRTAGVDVKIEELNWKQAQMYRLFGTEEKIPQFQDVLNLFGGKVPLIVELKCVDGNYDSLCRAACHALDGYNGPFCIESFDPRCILWLRRNRPDIVRGQLTENFFKSPGKMPTVLQFIMRHQLLNIFTNPDFVAYRFSDRKTISNLLALSLWKMQGVAWTIRSQEELDTAVKEGWIPIFEGFRP